jgi:hypothetical protein
MPQLRAGKQKRENTMIASLGRLGALAGGIAVTGAVVYYGSAQISSDLEALSGELTKEKAKVLVAQTP